jgi:predicted transcriptional regulator
MATLFLLEREGLEEFQFHRSIEFARKESCHRTLSSIHTRLLGNILSRGNRSIHAAAKQGRDDAGY